MKQAILLNSYCFISRTFFKSGYFLTTVILSSIYTWKYFPLTIIHPLKYTTTYGLIFTLPNSLLLKVADNVLFSIRNVLYTWLFRKFVLIVLSSNKALENRPNEFHSICGLKDVAATVCLKQFKIQQPFIYEGPPKWQWNFEK